MDPFTEKLLARTQARKTALAKKKEEVAGRSPVVTPRRPLLENNSSALRSTLTENNRKDTPVKGTVGTPVVVTSTQFAGGTPKSVFFEKYAKQTSLKQKECFIELEGVKEGLKSTPKKEKSNAGNKVSQLAKSTEEGRSTQNSHEPIENVIKASLDANTESPSVKDRRAMYMKQVQVVSTIPSKTSSSAAVKLENESEDLVATSISDRLFPSVKEARGSLSGGRYFNDPRSEHTSSKTSEKISCLAVPAKPPRITVASEANKEKKTMEAKNTNDVVPPKPPRSHSQSVAPVPPSKPLRNQVSECLGEDPQNKNLNGTGNAKRQAPTPPENDSCNGPQKDTLKKSKTAEVVQKATKRCEEEIRNHIPLKKSAHEGSRDVQKVIVATADDLLSPNRGFVVPQSSSPMATVSEGTLTHESQKEEFKRSLKSQKISAISLSEGDVNPHEITFNIDMADFDHALDDEKDSMFQMTYNESIKKAAEQEATHKPNDHGDDTHEDYEMAVPVQPNFKGVHKSGYHSSVSDQYAAMVTPNKPKATSTRKFSVHERIQMLLEEAAYQQNIVLQASQAVNISLALHEGVSSGSSEEVEAERLLKFSTERRTTCLDEVQKLKTCDTKDDACMNEQPEGFPCNATLTISGIKIALDQKLLQSKNSQELCIYSFICIVKHNPKQMYCTKAVTSDEIKNNCIIFDDKFEIKNVKPSFALDISVFMLKTLIPLANPVNKHKKKTAIAKKKTHDNAAQVTLGATHGPVFRTSGFALVASTQINLENVHHGKHKVHQVEGKSVVAGDLQIKIACNPEYCNQAKGFLTIFEDVGGLGDWLRYWCILDRNVLHYWKYPDEEIVKPPLGSIDLGYCVSDSVTIVRRDICARPHTMQLVLEKPVTSADRETLIAVNTGGKMIIKYMLSADTKADKTTWLNTLNDSLKDWRAWHHNLRSKHQHGNLYSNDVIML